MLAIVCPGQGAQTPGFLTPWLEGAEAREVLGQFSEFAQIDLVAHGTTSDEQTIRDTAVAQPLIVAASLLSARALRIGASTEPDATQNALFAGHSVGEIPAATLAGALSEDQAMQLIRVRAEAMADAAAAEQTGMAAVVGGAEDEVHQAISAAGLTPANVNGAGQIVASGTMERISALEQDAPPRARVVPLNVAGAFHTGHMASAQQALAETAATLTPAEATAALLSNRDGETVRAGEEILRRLIDQVTRPVRWDLCMQAMASQGVTGVLELLPAGTLTGLARRGLKGIPSVAVKTPEDLDAAAAFIAEHTT